VAARRALALGLATAIALLLTGTTSAQYAERPSLVGSGQPDVDATGRSIKNPRVRAVHTTDPSLPGGTAWFLDRDPFLAYQLGRNLNFREFRVRDGVFDATISGLGGPMVDGTTAKITTNNQTSCSGCHNQPYGNPGGGTNFAKDGGFARNAPHYFGAGLMEMAALRIRNELLAQIDADGDGWVSIAEAGGAPDPLTVWTGGASGTPVAFGSAALAPFGQPQLNRILRVWYGRDDGSGHVVIVPGATGVDGVTTTHYNFELVVWGWGQRAPPSALNPTNRAFLWDPWKAHGGLEAHDPSTLTDRDGDGVSLPTLAGALQFPATHRAPDPGLDADPRGFSRDDPDGDGHWTEISEGDLDLGEWFLLNAPRPAFAGTQTQYERGLRVFAQVGCTTCHVPDWTLPAAGSGQVGDRRLFDFQAIWNNATGRLEGRLTPLYDEVGGHYVRRFGEHEIRGVFTDFRHHEMGPAYAELAYDGTLNTVWRTAPLWGVGSGFPWDHDGRSLSLRASILRHGGEAQASRDGFVASSVNTQEQLVDWLGRMVLYDIESLPADIDGDGRISDDFFVAGENTGVERFNAEWLFRTPVQIQGAVVNADGVLIRSFAALNLSDAYGLTLTWRQDSDLDGWPDVWDDAPLSPGYKDGVNN
jgi:hypothetical protein